MDSGRPRILVIRRDNIGDLVCTLPLLAALRAAWPAAWIGALVTRYNAEVLHAHPDLDAVYTYQKLKHRARGEGVVGLLAERLGQLWQLRRRGLDLAILAAEGQQASARRMARLAGARRIVAAGDLPPVSGRHETERVLRVLDLLDLPAAAGPGATRPAAPRIVPRAGLVGAMRERLFASRPASLPAGNGALLGLHLSARKPSQRWPLAAWVALLRRLHGAHPDWRFVLFWAPGAADNPLHPGDDAKAAALLAECAGLPVAACATASLAELVAGLSLVDALVCADGGHMHLAAALGKPLVCLFGRSEAARWHPWGVPYRLLQPASLEVADVTPEEVAMALGQLPLPGNAGVTTVG